MVSHNNMILIFEIQQALEGQRAAELDRRRAALSKLLREEKEAYKQEMKDNEETTEQLAQRLQMQALALKSKREAEREEYSNLKLMTILNVLAPFRRVQAQ
jgi:hypothetical protein